MWVTVLFNTPKFQSVSFSCIFSLWFLLFSYTHKNTFVYTHYSSKPRRIAVNWGYSYVQDYCTWGRHINQPTNPPSNGLDQLNTRIPSNTYIHMYIHAPSLSQHQHQQRSKALEESTLPSCNFVFSRFLYALLSGCEFSSKYLKPNQREEKIIKKKIENNSLT